MTRTGLSGRFRQIEKVPVIVTVAAFICWAKAISGLWVWPLPGHEWVVNLAAAIMLGVIAAMCWLERSRVKREHETDESRSLLLRTLADALPVRPLEQTRPLPRAL